MPKNLIQILKNIGLTDKEAKVYISNIETGTAPVSKIAAAANINRVTTYDILDKLKQKGLVSHFTKNKIKFFTSISPELLTTEFEKRTSELKKSLPEFKKLLGKTATPVVRYFEGLDGIKKIYLDMLNSKTEILSFSAPSEIISKWPEYEEEHEQKRGHHKILSRQIITSSKIEPPLKSRNSAAKIVTHQLPHSFKLAGEISIYDNKIATVSFKEEMGIVVESAEISENHRQIFEICWQAAHFQPTTSQHSVKTKMMEPLKDEEIKKSLKEEALTAEPHKKEKKEPDTSSNLSLF